MTNEMAFKKAPKENLNTLSSMLGMFKWGSIGIAIVLLILAAWLL